MFNKIIDIPFAITEPPVPSFPVVNKSSFSTVEALVNNVITNPDISNINLLVSLFAENFENISKALPFVKDKDLTILTRYLEENNLLNKDTFVFHGYYPINEYMQSPFISLLLSTRVYFLFINETIKLRAPLPFDQACLYLSAFWSISPLLKNIPRPTNIVTESKINILKILQLRNNPTIVIKPTAKNIYNPLFKLTTLNKDNPALFHEIGHYVYHSLSKQTKKIINTIYTDIISNIELKEAAMLLNDFIMSPAQESILAGHIEDNASELFASLFNIVLSQNKDSVKKIILLNNIAEPIKKYLYSILDLFEEFITNNISLEQHPVFTKTPMLNRIKLLFKNYKQYNDLKFKTLPSFIRYFLSLSTVVLNSPDLLVSFFLKLNLSTYKFYLLHRTRIEYFANKRTSIFNALKNRLLRFSKSMSTMIKKTYN